MTPTVTLLSTTAVKWPRYEIQLEPGLRLRDAMGAAFRLLRTQARQRLMFSQFSYDAKTGIVDTRVNRQEF
jgi:hypothetical protein